MVETLVESWQFRSLPSERNRRPLFQVQVGLCQEELKGPLKRWNKLIYRTHKFMEVILKATETTRIRFKILLPFTLLAALLDVPGRV